VPFRSKRIRMRTRLVPGARYADVCHAAILRSSASRCTLASNMHVKDRHDRVSLTHFQSSANCLLQPACSEMTTVNFADREDG
jgi:hypothetical protein